MASVFVGNIAWQTSEQDLGDAFARYGPVSSVKIIQDRETGRSKGFGFVEFSDPSCIENACRQMDGQEIGGRALRVNPANNRN
jgi:RNA recognition motif-containing protein